MKKITLLFLSVLLCFNVFSQVILNTAELDFGTGYVGTSSLRNMTFEIENKYSKDRVISIETTTVDYAIIKEILPTSITCNANGFVIFSVGVKFPEQEGTYSTQFKIQYHALGSTSTAEINGPVIKVKSIALPPVPSIPTNFVAGNITDNSCNLSWTKPSGVVSSYNIFKNGSYIKSTTSTSYTVTGLSQSTNYVFSVNAINAGGESGKAQISVRTLPTPPAISFSNVTPNSCFLSWASTSAARYDIYKNDVKIISTTSTSATISNLCSEIQYNFYVKAYDNVKYSDKSNIVSPKTGKYVISGSDIVCTSNKTFSITSIPAGAAVTWTKSNKNLVYVSGQGTSSYTVKAASSTVSGSATITAVISYGECSKSLSKMIWVGRPGQPTITPSGYPTVEMNVDQRKFFNATSTPGNPTSYRWSVTGNPCGVEITNGSTSKYCTMYANSVSWNNYYFQTTNACGSSPNAGGAIKVTDGGGQMKMSTSSLSETNISSKPTNEFENIDGNVSTEDLNIKLVVSPNPANDNFEASLENIDNEEFLSNEKLQITLFNSRSVAVYNGVTQQNKFKINTSNYQEGIYYLQVVFKNKKYTATVIISHN